MRHMRIWRYVDEVARAGSLRRAAERLNITASALQRRIQDVEEDLGTTLFERLPTGMRLTAAGEAFIRWVRSQASDLERVRSQIEDLSGLRRGLVRIACSQALAAFLLPQEIARFTTAHPSVHFAVSVSDHKRAVTMLRDYEADLALVFQPGRYPEFEPLMAVGQRLMAIMAADHPLASRTDTPAAGLCRISAGIAGSRLRRPADRRRHHGRRVNPTWTSASKPIRSSSCATTWRTPRRSLCRSSLARCPTCSGTG